MKRVIIICEGQTEQEFCKDVLYPYLQTKGIYIETPLIKKTKGGIVKWDELKKQIELHLKQDKTAWVTTLVDYYGIKERHEFPNWKNAQAEPNKNKRMEILESAMHTEIDEAIQLRYLPYIQLHEFEGLLFNNISIFYQHIPLNELIGLKELQETFNNYPNPELINDGNTSAPSKRLDRIIKGYEKVVYGAILAEAIGLQCIRNKSPRFNEWVTKIEKL